MRAILVAGLCCPFVAGSVQARDVGPVPSTALNQANGPAQLDSAGRLSGQSVLPTGGLVARTLGDRAGDALSATDFGAAGDGATADSTAFQAAQNYRQGQAGGTVRVRPGLYALDRNVYTAGNVTWLFEGGARVTGSGQLDAVADSATLNASGLSLARLYSSSTNEHGLFVTARAAPTSGSTPYEKSGVIVSLIQNDPSTYANGALKDLVAFEGQGLIEAGNLTGRIWGINTGVGPGIGADGYAVGGEFGVQSYSGSPAGPLGTATSKIGVHVVAYGNSSSTAALVASGNGTTWQDGLVVQQGAIDVGAHALSVRPTGTSRSADVAWVARDGSAGLTREAAITSGGIGVARKRVMTAVTSSAGSVELTDDGAAPSPANTITPGSNSALVIKNMRLLAFGPTTGFAASYHIGDVLVSRGTTASALVSSPASVVLSLDQQAGASPGPIGLSVALNTTSGRVMLTVTTGASTALHFVAEVETIEAH